MNRIKTAQKIFREGFNCSQSVLFAFSDKTEIPQDILLKLGTGFGAGIAREGEICGALSAGVILLGLKFGRGLEEKDSQTEVTYLKVQELFDQFKGKNSSSFCNEILNGCKLNTPEGQMKFEQEGLFEIKCMNCVSSAVEIIENCFETD